MKSLRIHPATFLFLIFLAVTGYSSVIIPYFVAIVLHEFGHAFVSKKLGYKLDKIWILPFGACISFNEFSFDPKDEIKIAFAGPIVNLFLILLTMTCWWISPISYVYTYNFAIANFSIALFNLLPAFPLDGGRILTGILRASFSSKKVYKVAFVLNLVFSLLFLTLFIITIFVNKNDINYTLGLTAIFLFISSFDGKFQGKYSPILYQFSKRKGLKPITVKNFCVQSSTPFYKIIPELNNHKFNVVYVLYPNGTIKLVTENQFQKILEKNTLKNTFEDIQILKKL